MERDCVISVPWWTAVFVPGFVHLMHGRTRAGLAWLFGMILAYVLTGPGGFIPLAVCLIQSHAIEKDFRLSRAPL